MVEERRDPRESKLEEISAARRAAMLRFAIQQQKREGHHAEAMDMYRQLIEEYPDTEEEGEARERMLDLGYMFGSENKPYRMLSLYNSLETMYAPRATKGGMTDAARTRVKEILEDVRQQKERDAEAEARIEARREGVTPPLGAAALPPEREKPPREAQKRTTRRQGGPDEASARAPEEDDTPQEGPDVA